MGDHFSHRLVVRNDARGRRVDAVADGLAIDLDLIAKLDSLPNVGWLVVDGDAPLHDELLHLKPRAHARLCQHFMKLGRFCLRGQYAFWRREFCDLFVGIKLARYHVVKPVGGCMGQWAT